MKTGIASRRPTLPGLVVPSTMFCPSCVTHGRQTMLRPIVTQQNIVLDCHRCHTTNVIPLHLVERITRG